MRRDQGSNHRGQSIVELTLMTPLLLIALYVPFDFGMAIFTGHLTQNAVRDAVRTAAFVATFGDPDATAGERDAAAAALAAQIEPTLPDLLTARSVTVRYFAGGAAGCMQYVEVQAQGTYNYFLYRLIALFGMAPPTSDTITRATRMRYERQDDANGGKNGNGRAGN